MTHEVERQIFIRQDFLLLVLLIFRFLTKLKPAVGGVDPTTTMSGSRTEHTSFSKHFSAYKQEEERKTRSIFVHNLMSHDFDFFLILPSYKASIVHVMSPLKECWGAEGKSFARKHNRWFDLRKMIKFLRRKLFKSWNSCFCMKVQFIPSHPAR